MELLKPSHPPQHHSNRQEIGIGFERTIDSPRLPNIDVEEENRSGNGEIRNPYHNSSNCNCEKVYVSVGKSVHKTVSLLQWSFKHFTSRELCLLHVHKPSPLIPTLLGKMPATRANPEVVSAYRRDEIQQTRKLLQTYLILCNRAKVKASIVAIEFDQVQKGIIELVNKYGVGKLVMGATPENCMKVTKSSGKVSYVAKYAPLFCEIWFVNKGKHIWTREASKGLSSLSSFGNKEAADTKILQCKSLYYSKDRLIVHPEYIRSNSATNIVTTGNWDHSESICTQTESLHTNSSNRCSLCPVQDSFDGTNTSSSSEHSSVEQGVSSGSDSKVDKESLYGHLAEVSIEATVLKYQAFDALLKSRQLESEAFEAISRVKISESAYAFEVKCKNEAEDALRTAIQEQEKVMEEREELRKKLKRTMRNIALLDSRAQEANRRHDEAVGELKLIQTSIESLRQEKQKIQHQKIEAVHWLDRWRSNGQVGASMYNGFLGFVEELPELPEFSFSDLKTATCNFSESFKLGQGGYGCVYKGEMLGRTVVIRKLHPHNMQRQSEFQKEVQILGKLQHPHLLTLLGACSEAWSLVYEYSPNGSLQDRLSQKSNVSPLTWKDRVRIVAEIASALCFLHSAKPERIVHGDLKLQNILLDSDLSCKICEFGLCRLVAEDSPYCPSFYRSTEPKSAFAYTDPEFHRIGVLTPKSDVYSFGVIILQLLTGRSPINLVGDVRRTTLNGGLTSVLDPSAGEWPLLVARRLVDLALQFCEPSSRSRPDLAPAIVRELELLHVSDERPVPSFFLCPILQEIMHDPQVAADGFTYEAEAIRGWLENGHGTSPMTNLKLSHMLLTPNHAIRLAIQDWLCKS